MYDQEESRNMEENRQREQVTPKELRTLRSFNLPGTGENLVGESGIRVRLRDFGTKFGQGGTGAKKGRARGGR